MRAYDPSVTPKPRKGPAASPGFLLWHVTHRWQSTLAARLVPLGLTPAQFSILGSVLWLGGSATELPMQREVADHAGTDPMMTSQLLRTLERRGLVVRRKDRHDRRARRIGTTPEGQRLTREAIRIVQRVDAEFFTATLGDPAPFIEVLRGLARASGASTQVVGEKS